MSVVDVYTGGDPTQEDVRWTSLSRPEIAACLNQQGFAVSVTVVDRLLEEFHMNYRPPQKIKTMIESPQRDAQFQHIAQLRRLWAESGEPILSMDVKKREMLGNYARPGKVLSTARLPAWDHDFPTHSRGVVIPHGLYDLELNEGYVHLGTSHDTSRFAADAVIDWWRAYGRRRYPDADTLLLLCDAGGSNSCRRLVFKKQLERVADATGLWIRVAHYPTGCSKFNPIDHRLFPHLARKCQGMFLTSAEQVRDLMRRAVTATGLRTFVRIVRRAYETGQRAAARAAANLRIVFDAMLPQWNYIVVPTRDWEVI